MSVPLPSPSPLPSSSFASISPTKRTSTATEGSPSLLSSSPSGHGGSSLNRKGSIPSRTAWSGTSHTPSEDRSGDGNWRDRNGSTGNGSKTRQTPERTVGFDKKASKEAIALSQASKPTENGADSKTAALSHVPCRFFKAGACTAGASCPFSHEEGGKKEVCQWFLKGNCKFGHKCALAHIRPGEPISMDRKNKKEQQRQSREQHPGDFMKSEAISTPNKDTRQNQMEEQASPVPIRSALSSSLQSPPIHRDFRQPGQSIGTSSPLREPYGPPSAAVGSPSAGFGRSPGTFGASPSRPSPLSGSFSLRNASGTLKAPNANSIHSPLRPPISSAAPGGGFSSSFSHSSLSVEKPVPLSASFADSPMRRSIWARSETPDEPLSPRRPIPSHIQRHADVFDDDDDHGEDLLPSSLSELLTPTERARRLSRRDSGDSFGASPGRPRPPFSAHLVQSSNGERLAQSAGATMGPGNFLQSLWSQAPGGAGTGTSPTTTGVLGTGSGGGGVNAELNLGEGRSTGGQGQEFAFGPTTVARPTSSARQSLLSQSRAGPISPHRSRPGVGGNGISPHRPPPQEWKPDTNANETDGDAPGSPYFTRKLDPSSPSAKALQEHAPGQSLPGGVATALSRLHLRGAGSVVGSGLANEKNLNDFADDATIGNGNGIATPPLLPTNKKEEVEEAMFAMDG